MAPIAGVYQVNGNVRWTGTANANSGTRFLAIDVDGTHYAMSWIPVAPGGMCDQSVSALVKVPAGKPLTLAVFSSVSGQDIEAGTAHFSMTWVGAG